MTPTIVKFATLSLALHAIALLSWSTTTTPKPRVSATLSVGFAVPTALPQKSDSNRAQTKPKAPTPRLANPPRLSKRVQAEALATSAQSRAPVLAPRAAPKRTAVPRAAIGRQTAVTSAVHPANIGMAKGSADPEPVEPAAQSLIEVGTLPVSQPRRPVKGSVPSHTPKPQPATASAPALHAEAAPPMDAARSDLKAHELTRARVRGQLETDLSRYFSYPALARKQGWQGHVNVAFTVESNGQLTNVRVTRSSGYYLLDQSALAALRKVGHLAEAPQWLNGQSITVELPVIYRLEN